MSGFITTVLTSLLVLVAGPVFQCTLAETTVQACMGRNITIRCSRKEVSKSSFKWSFNGLPASPDKYNLIYSGNYSQLTIKNYASVNEGLYSCKQIGDNGVQLSERTYSLKTYKEFNISTRIVHHQYYEDHLLFIHFQNGLNSSNTDDITYFLEYRCLSAFEIFPLCVKRWQPISRCSFNKSTSEMYYNCMILHDQVLINLRYEVRAAVKTPCHWRNESSQFKVAIPNFSEPLEELRATAIDHDTVELTWKKIHLLRDVGKFETENIKMVMKILITSDNSTITKEAFLKPFVVSTRLHGFKPLKNYSFIASYHLIVSSLPLQSSKISGPVTVQMPEKVIASDPAVNQSCHKFSNSTANFFNISWTAPSSSRNVGTNLNTKISLVFANTQMVHNIDQKPGTKQFFIQDAFANMDVLISICNKAGCSESVKAICVLSAKESKGSTPKTNTLQYILASLVALVSFIVVIFILVYFFKKRKPKKENESNEIPVYGPRPRNPYDEVNDAGHEYTEMPISSILTPAVGFSEDTAVGNSIAAISETSESVSPSRKTFSGEDTLSITNNGASMFSNDFMTPL